MSFTSPKFFRSFGFNLKFQLRDVKIENVCLKHSPEHPSDPKYVDVRARAGCHIRAYRWFIQHHFLYLITAIYLSMILSRQKPIPDYVYTQKLRGASIELTGNQKIATI